MKKILTTLFSLLMLSSLIPAFASSNPQIPPTAEGPGFILPDSPFFFLDELKQAVRITFALTPEAKASVHAQIAGERLAELRFMLDRDNSEGIEKDLLGISQNLRESAKDVKDAKLLGHDVKILAKSINDDIKAKQAIFDKLSKESNAPLKSWAFAVADSLASAKATVEEALPADLAANEIKDDAQRVAVLGASSSSSSAKPQTK